jgi:MEMO1 family protein
VRKSFAAFLLLLAGAAALSAAPAQKGGDRAPAAAGTFYPAEPDRLRASVDAFLAGAQGAAPEGQLVGLIVPHAGHGYCGPVLAEAARHAKGSWDTFVLVGPSHKMPLSDAAVYPRGAFLTPLGRAPVNAGLAAELLKDPRFRADTWTHAQEHSLEAPLPFFQRVSPKSKVLPVAVNNADPKFVEQAGRALGRLLKRPGVLLVVSSDFSHYPSRETGWAADLTILRALESLDEDRLRGGSPTCRPTPAASRPC